MESQSENHEDPLSRQDVIYFFLVTVCTIGSIAVGFRLYSKIFPDSEKYLLLVDWFHGQISTSELIAPWSYRPLTSFLASLVPLDPVLSFLMVNTILLLLLNYIIYLICREFRFSKLSSFLVTSIYTFSHPSVGYGVAVLVEAGSMLSIALIAYVLLQKPDQKHRLYILLLLVMGVCFRETVIVMAGAYLFYTRDWKTFIPLFIISGSVYLLNRTIFNPGVSDTGYFWSFHLNNFILTGSNTIRMVILAFQFIIPFMVIGLYVLRNRTHERKTVLNWLITIGVPLSGITIFGLFFASFTSRFIWPLYISFIPLVGKGVEGFIDFFRGIIMGLKLKDDEMQTISET
ncbi:MAG: hypothetical protein ACFFE6_00460 [Candidatus Thorarchaeota archaeon]